MPVTMADVRAVLDPDEPDYRAAATLGHEALPYLDDLAQNADALLASKAVFLAALIQDERSVQIVTQAARRDDPIVRVAAAAAVPYLPCKELSEVLLPLVNDQDSSVRRVALESATEGATAELRASIERLTQEESDPSMQQVARQTLGRISFGYQADDLRGTVEGSGMGSAVMGHGGMGSSVGATGMGQGGMGYPPDGSEETTSAWMEQLGTGTADESTAAAAWERAAVAWEKAAEAREKNQ